MDEIENKIEDVVWEIIKAGAPLFAKGEQEIKVANDMVDFAQKVGDCSRKTYSNK